MTKSKFAGRLSSKSLNKAMKHSCYCFSRNGRCSEIACNLKVSTKGAQDNPMHFQKSTISDSQRKVDKSPFYKHGMQIWDEGSKMMIPFQTDIE